MKPFSIAWVKGMARGCRGLLVPLEQAGKIHCRSLETKVEEGMKLSLPGRVIQLECMIDNLTKKEDWAKRVLKQHGGKTFEVAGRDFSTNKSAGSSTYPVSRKHIEDPSM